MSTELQLLIAEDSQDDALLLLRELQKAGYQPVWHQVDSSATMKAALESRKWDIVISDFSMPGFSGLDALRIVKESGLDIPFIIVSGKIGEETAVEAMRSGAHDYIIKGNLARLVPAIEREMGEAEVRRKRRQAEEALRESEGRYRVLLESVTDYIYTTQVEEGRPVATAHGPGCVAVTGYSAEEFAADPDLWIRMVHEEDRPAVLEQADAVLTGRTISSLEHRIIHKDGRVCWIRNTPVPFYNQQGCLMAYDGIVADITKPRESEEEIRMAKEEWERTFDAITDPILILDTDYRIVKANSVLLEKLGLTQSEVAEVTCYRTIHETPQPPSYCPNMLLLADAQPHSAEFNEPRLGGYFSTKASPVFSPSGKLHGSICVMSDITERKNLETMLNQSQKMEAIGQLAGGIAHDFNNIITAIIGFSSIMKMKLEADDPQSENINHILAAADKAADLTRSLLTFSRKQIIKLQPCNLNQIIRNFERFIQRIIGEDIIFSTTYHYDALTVNADCGQIEQLLMNLATNARDAMSNGGLLTIETGHVDMEAEYAKSHGLGEAGGYAQITVTDSGIGMDETTRKRVFEPFFSTKEVGKGTGLGLSNVYGIVRQHNGYINVYSKQGGGTTFIIYLPLIHTVVGEHTGSSEEVLKEGTETILVADDDATLRELSKNILEQFGYSVITAENGRDAVNTFRMNRDKIGLVILDVIMPVLNGKEASDEISRIRPGIKTIFISGYSADIVQKRGVLGEGVEVLSKPMKPAHLLQKVREVLDR